MGGGIGRRAQTGSGFHARTHDPTAKPEWVFGTLPVSVSTGNRCLRNLWMKDHQRTRLHAPRRPALQVRQRRLPIQSSVATHPPKPAGPQPPRVRAPDTGFIAATTYKAAWPFGDKCALHSITPETNETCHCFWSMSSDKHPVARVAQASQLRMLPAKTEQCPPALRSKLGCRCQPNAATLHPALVRVRDDQ